MRDSLLARDKTMLDRGGDAVASDTRRFFSRHRIEDAAARDERQRVEREVHDGALQALTAVSLQLDALRRLIPSEPIAAGQLATRLQETIAEEQRTLRAWFAAHRLAGVSRNIASDELIAALRTLCERSQSQWGLQVKLRHGVLRSIPHELPDHIYRLVQESIANVGKHARAANASVRIDIYTATVNVVVADDGVGFVLRGRHDLAALQRMAQGPRSLMHRVASLRGEMWLTSAACGTTLEFSLPTGAANRVYRSP